LQLLVMEGIIIAFFLHDSLGKMRRTGMWRAHPAWIWRIYAQNLRKMWVMWPAYIMKILRAPAVHEIALHWRKYTDVHTLWTATFAVSLTNPLLVGKCRKMLIPQPAKVGRHRERTFSGIFNIPALNLVDCAIYPWMYKLLIRADFDGKGLINTTESIVILQKDHKIPTFSTGHLD
jgi:hypothetical protein